MRKPVYSLDWWDRDNIIQKSCLGVNYKPPFLDLKESAVNKIADYINM